ncbi:MAG: type I-E CRISPR-associated protein Cas7/Cse4/CasC [candidate division Zixibacteria bacterium]|nr:type I-E CRISPR-associated protein Cas7/Cse4/CasC [candidate division Zixibacteria bacterium]
MLVEIHILQNFAPSCLNRDDTNTPKTCDFGGYPRARISSQCTKRAIRTSDEFKNRLGENIAIRTKRLHQNVKAKLAEADITDEAVDDIISNLIAELYSKMDKKHKDTTSVALYLSNKEIDSIVNAIRDNFTELANKKNKDAAKNLASELKTKIRDAYAADIALHGRMMAEKPEFSIDAACQVAQSISTNKINTEMDFFTAVDDLLPKGETGAGMMGIVEYNSSCYYRYANVDLRQLMHNLRNDEDLARRTLEGFLHGAIMAIPTGKQTSMAANNLPSFVFTVVRDNGLRCSLANAFVKPAAPDYKNSLIENSADKLDKFWGNIQKAYGSDGIKTMAVCQIGMDKLDILKAYEVESIKSLIEKTMLAVKFEEQTTEK